MFSDALKILDDNTVQYMIDEMQNTINYQKAQLSDKDSLINDQAAEIAALKNNLHYNKNKICYNIIHDYI